MLSFITKTSNLIAMIEFKSRFLENDIFINNLLILLGITTYYNRETLAFVFNKCDLNTAEIQNLF